MSDTAPPPVAETPDAAHPVAEQDSIAIEKAYLRELEAKPLGGRLLGYIKLSGPGWLQSALTLGGGSLATGLYLGVLCGFGLMWLQPLAMILGIIMLSAIGYVTLSTGERPFRVINRHINPMLGWGWLIASMLANMVWALPQYSLASGVLRQNLAPGLLGVDGSLGDLPSKIVIAVCILVATTAVTWSYGSGHWGVRVYEWMLKGIVAVIVACFMGVVIRLSFTSNGLDWGSIFAGFVPNFSLMWTPASGFSELLDAIREKAPDAASYWEKNIVSQQKDVLMGAFATAVGINMTFLLPYSMLGRGWSREHRGLAIFDLSTGMFIPFLLATSCVVIAAASQFHLQYDEAELAKADEAGSAVHSVLGKRLAKVTAEDEPVTDEEKVLAATLLKRDVGQLSGALEPLLGSTVANLIFGLGVLGMALSTITLLMLVSGFVVCELMDVPATGWPMRIGSLAACTGVAGVFFWKQAAAWLAVPTSVFGLVLLPVAYISFLLLMNSKSVLGDDRPSGGMRVFVNILLITATVAALFGSGWAVVNKVGVQSAIGIGVAAVVLLIVGEFIRRGTATKDAA
ncbi:divalent metal cation transporter [Calycomorphotria hydatis]|uniref:Natural resistance-associated macrophage protein n=1 Tax=Calycomorphotria hydatis TaxID=2528027 RepID=A0A517T7X5_9PLAN|nr:divalent metal cation transporter [Calycomorphotria hydatis]QDT64476.1 Natural resistance-associated macrophage protein [Calycomorphotria hydatis]